jgi:hypothetical protein
MVLVPDVRSSIVEVIDLKAIFENLYLKLQPPKSDCAPAPFCDAIWQWATRAAERQRRLH